MKTKNKDVHRSGSTPRDVFFHLLAMIALYTGVIGFITLLFQCVNVLFPDALDYNYYSWDGIRQSMASVIVVWPVFLGMSWLIYKDIRKDSKKQDTAIRKWLLYLTLLISAITMIVDSITLLYNFLGGELTLRFAIKVLVVLFVAGGVFGYYTWDIKRKGEKKTSIPKTLAIVSGVIAVSAIIAGFFIVGSPATQRAKRLDQTRVENLQSIQYQITNFWQQTGALPETLNDIKNIDYYFTAPSDPETQIAYEYRVKNTLSFELCAIFITEVKESTSSITDRTYPKDPYLPSGTWFHGAERTCFTKIIDPKLTPRYNQTIQEPIPLPVPIEEPQQ